MDGSVPSELETFLRTGLGRLGVSIDEVELAVMTAVDGIYRDQLDALMSADLSGVEAEAELDLSRAPR